jgi:hypothetical protein
MGSTNAFATTSPHESPRVTPPRAEAPSPSVTHLPPETQRPCSETRHQRLHPSRPPAATSPHVRFQPATLAREPGQDRARPTPDPMRDAREPREDRVRPAGETNAGGHPTRVKRARTSEDAGEPTGEVCEDSRDGPPRTWGREDRARTRARTAGAPGPREKRASTTPRLHPGDTLGNRRSARGIGHCGHPTEAPSDPGNLDFGRRPKPSDARAGSEAKWARRWKGIPIITPPNRPGVILSPLSLKDASPPPGQGRLGWGSLWS